MRIADGKLTVTDGSVKARATFEVAAALAGNGANMTC
jgi:hypothetical protein